MKDNNTKTTTTEANIVDTTMINGDSVTRDVTLKVHTSYATKQYSKFDFIKGNRGISPTHVNSLTNKINNGENFLVFKPIMVDAQFRVLDGQHRLLAAQAAGVHIWYNVVTGKINLDTIARINESQRKWAPNNFVSMYASLGNSHYKAFESFCGAYKISVSTAMTLFGTHMTMKSLREGSLEVHDILSAEEVADALLDVRRYVKFAKYNRFATAFKRVFEHTDYDHKRMMRKLKQRKDTVKKLTSVLDYIRLLEGIYNYSMTEANIVRFF